jgi:hypothetical protein
MGLAHLADQISNNLSTGVCGITKEKILTLINKYVMVKITMRYS